MRKRLVDLNIRGQLSFSGGMRLTECLVVYKKLSVHVAALKSLLNILRSFVRSFKKAMKILLLLSCWGLSCRLDDDDEM